jgi:hypothetical protein
MVSSPITTTSSIHANWQEGAGSSTANPNPGFGTHITGSTTDQNNGFDGTSSGNSSLFSLDVSGQAFVAVDNTDVNTLTAGEGYLMFVRGSRAIDLTASPAPAADATILRATGNMFTGTFTDNTNVSQTAGEFNMIGNPYQSAVDMTTVIADSQNLNGNFMYIYDPNLGASGAYVTVILADGSNTSGSDADEFLQPGQGAQIATATNGATSIIINESAKAPGNYASTSRSTANNEGTFIIGQLFTAENYATGNSLHDSFKLMFDAGFDNALNNADAVKPFNFTENMGIGSLEAAYSVERRAMPVAEEEISLFMNNHNHESYMLRLEASEFDGVTAYLKDNFTGQDTELQAGENLYSFTIDLAVEESVATTRFSVYFTENALGLDNVNGAYGVELYPNPAAPEDAFYITAGQFSGDVAQISMTDMFGKTVYRASHSFVNGKLSIQPENSLSSGVYFVQVAQDGKKVVKRLIVK